MMQRVLVRTPNEINGLRALEMKKSLDSTV